ncbi:hypothetical protein K7G98_27470, partial [Saccharothrix sp. MB29]|nr:hypothetical protein [Saccharothrix sp. MB29]
GLIVTGGFAPNRVGSLYPFASKLTTRGEARNHRAITQAVHENGGKIALQLLHAGRYAYHPFSVSASAIKAPISKFRPRALGDRGVRGQVDAFARQIADALAGRLVLRPEQVPHGALVVVLSTFLDADAVELAVHAARRGNVVLAVDVLPSPLRADRDSPWGEAAAAVVGLEHAGRGRVVRDLGGDDLHWVVQVAQRGDLGAGLRVLERLHVLVADLLLGLAGAEELLARRERVPAADPQAERAEQRHVVGERHRRHGQPTAGRERLLTLDRHDVAAVDLTQRVVGRTGAQRHVRHPGEPAEQPEDQDHREADHQGPRAPGQAAPRGLRGGRCLVHDGVGAFGHARQGTTTRLRRGRTGPRRRSSAPPRRRIPRTVVA